MSDESNAVAALKNAWSSAMATSDRIRELGTGVQGLPDSAHLSASDLTTYHNAALAHAIAVQALRGLIEQLQRKAGAA